MTEERKTPDPGVPDDSRVTDIYRDVARERAPEHLDQVVLREAARAVRPRYQRLRLWTRPAAWAAIVLLSATLLLQISQVQPPQSGRLPEVLELEDRAAKRELAEPEASVERQRDNFGSTAKATGTTVPRLEAQTTEVLEEADTQDADMFTPAEQMPRIQQAPADAPAAPAAASAIAPQADEAEALAGRASADTAMPSCDETARATPEAWLDCISQLEDAGFTAAVERERRLLAETFPNFEMP